MRIDALLRACVPALVLVVAAACGGATVEGPSNAGGSSEPKTSTGIPAGRAEISGTLTDVNGVPVAAADVRLPFGTGQYYGTTTDSKGAFTFTAPTSDFGAVRPVALTVYKDRYVPKTYLYVSLTQGVRYTLTTSASDAPRVLAANEFAPTGVQGLWHVGDLGFVGNATLQFQMARSGPSVAFPVTAWNAQMRSQYHTATITFIARGIQTSGCPMNRIGLYSDAGTQTAYVAPPDSDPNGDFTSYRLTIPLPAFPDGRLMFGAVTGLCLGSELDDWEFSQVLVTLS
ncbi:MAG: carboxypeptidase-like regulatory domain-containing protein [Gammaproteobacteria bacterium]